MKYVHNTSSKTEFRIFQNNGFVGIIVSSPTKRVFKPF